ncbi:MAG: acyl carrier protein [Flavobacteriaceae bacterium]
MGFLDKLFGKPKPENHKPGTYNPPTGEPGAIIKGYSKVESALIRAISDMTGLDGPFKLTDSVDSLGLDSLDVLEITMELEEDLGIEIPDADIENFRTLGDVLEYLSSRLGISYTHTESIVIDPAPTDEADRQLEIEEPVKATEEPEEVVEEPVKTSYIVTDAKDMSKASQLEAAMETIKYNGGDIEQYFREMSENLISRHGPLVGVDYMSHFPKFEIYFAYQDGMRIYSGERSGDVDINFLTLGYYGEGPRYAKQFLSAAGFEMTPEQIDSIEPGDSLALHDGKVKIIKKSEKVVEDDMGDVKFLRERNEISYGTPAIYRHYSAPDKATAKEFLDKQTITAQSYFVVVETPEGTISKDRMGVFE